MSLEEIIVTGEEALKVADALTSTSYKILQLLSREALDVTTIAERLELSEAYMSKQIRLLEGLRLVSVNYEKGKQGIRKVCRSAVRKITIVIVPEI